MIDTAIWDTPDMRAALARRDIPAVYRGLKVAGVTQRDIAALTGQHQSEVSAIVPRTYMGWRTTPKSGTTPGRRAGDSGERTPW
jgi:hypothetical protein